MSRTVTLFREIATFGDAMPERVVNQWLEARIALHTPVSGATTWRPRTVTSSSRQRPSKLKRSTRLLPASAMVTTLRAASCPPPPLPPPSRRRLVLLSRGGGGAGCPLGAGRPARPAFDLAAVTSGS